MTKAEASQRQSVLILEDEYLTATMLAKFVSAAGYEVVGPVPSVDKAQALINERGIDAALLDINLGGDARSFELAARLQAIWIPFAFVTAYPIALWPPGFRRMLSIRKPLARQDVAGVLSKLFSNNELA